jgi:uncharacterized spore protein YtfJ
MAEFDPVEMVNALMSGVAKLGEAVQVIREPITAGNKVIIPAVVARLAIGAGGGSGHREGRLADGPPKVGSGGGGGGGVTISPVFLIVDAEGERLVTVPDAVQSTSAVIEKLTEVAGSVFARRPSAGRPASEPSPQRP